MKVFATAQVQGAYKVEEVQVYANSDNVPRVCAPGWKPMKWNKGDFASACRKIASHPGFIKFVEN